MTHLKITLEFYFNSRKLSLAPLNFLGYILEDELSCRSTVLLYSNDSFSLKSRAKTMPRCQKSSNFCSVNEHPYLCSNEEAIGLSTLDTPTLVGLVKLSNVACG